MPLRSQATNRCISIRNCMHVRGYFQHALESDFVFDENGESLGPSERKLMAIADLDSVLIWHQYVVNRTLGVKKKKKR